ncbi:hypothetical protein DAEQUDRAFT_771037 [Daedalea quercina L-15889]|uniref:Uncharacterized protein n=1 Tax=Daedalea quercina L-15889 TaxID=1314783 RepID=A0A165KEB0_9APHY|nr:hypothetical protein DAEQUDRAFT_771037 [Daedalea quercina L-15889]
MAMELVSSKNKEEPPKMLEEMIPPYLHDFLLIFDKGIALHLVVVADYLCSLGYFARM